MNKQEIEKAIEVLKELQSKYYETRYYDDINLAISALQQLLLYVNLGLSTSIENTAVDISRLYGEGYRKGFDDCRKLNDSWTLVTDGLPEKAGHYKCTVKTSSGNEIREQVWYSPDSNYKWRWGQFIIDDIMVAWQCNLNPYKEASE